ncbi:peptide deformylase [Nisaea sp.]|uniref:peptide deformylase n=1 Tax=Nisaea sp. TaxID=2024842 RepID=UPI0032995901
MTAHQIVRMGAPVLGRRADEILDPASEEIAALAADMADSMAAAGGVGLAAPQIGVPKRIIVFKVPGERATAAANDGPLELQILINPEIEPLSGEMELGWEGCLSIPGLKGEVPRYRKIAYRGVDLQGEKVLRQAEGFHARVVQHEVDHLDGILYPERMTDMRRIGYGEELLQAAVDASPEDIQPDKVRGDGK